MLYICATPIGNLEDITLRVLRTLREVDLIVAEDTRRTLQLLNHFEITNKLTSLHQHNEHARAAEIVDLLKSGQEIALVSDAGIPGISDPGAELIRLVIEEGLPLTVLPGANAALTAFVQSGLKTDAFYFCGFLPRKHKELREELNKLKNLSCPLIFYEAPHRLLKVLPVLREVLGDRQCAVSRELTKKFEETIRGRLSEIEAHFTKQEPRGEFVITVDGAEAVQKEPVIDIKEQLLVFLNQGMSRKDAIKATAAVLGVNRNLVYQHALELKGE